MKQLPIIIFFITVFGGYSQTLRLDKDTVFEDYKEEITLDTLLLNNNKAWIKSSKGESNQTVFKVNVIIGPGVVIIDKTTKVIISEKPSKEVRIWYVEPNESNNNK
ncbi:hypothetical protein [Pseudofulvibacter geojedonensis]|uniref:Uncharacterized protein n=1 Tax=Pseudofulvibacter geojedonensis TaxID=1123758 RepID=A0ABW3I1V4_9FLAO